MHYAANTKHAFQTIIAFAALSLIITNNAHAGDTATILKALHNAPGNLSRIKAGATWPNAPMVIGNWVINSPTPSGAATIIARNRKTGAYCLDRINTNPTTEACTRVWRMLARRLR